MSEDGPRAARVSSLINMPKFAARREIGAMLAVFALIIIGSAIRPDVFLTIENFLGVMRNTAVTAIIGYGMTIMIVSGEFDLSVGSWMAVSMALTAILFLDGWSLLSVLFFILIVSMIYGLFQGLLVTKLGLPSLIVTIGTLTLLRGVMLVLTDGLTISIPSGQLGAMFYFGGSLNPSIVPGVTVTQFPVQIIWMLVILGVMYHILNQTAFGLRSQFTGGDSDSARRTGIKTDQVKIINFMLIASLAAFAGVTQLAFTQAVGPLTGRGIELTVIAAVVIGGTNLFGGEGSMTGTFVGALVFAITQNVLVLAGLGTQLFQILSGIFIILAVLVEVLSRDIRLPVLITHYMYPLTRLLETPKEFFSYVKTDLQGIDEPVTFLTINTLIMTILFLMSVLIGDAVLTWEFNLLFVSTGVAAVGTVPVFTFGAITVLTLLSVVFLHTFVKLTGSAYDFDTTVQTVAYSMAPSIILFIPALLSGWGFVTSLIIASGMLVIIPSVYLLYAGVRMLHELRPRDAIVSVGATLFVWVFILTVIMISAPTG